MGIHVLGPLDLEGRATPGRRDRVVLAALVVARPHVVSTDRLTGIIWPEGPPPTAAKVIQGCVARLRNTLGAVAIVTTDQGYRLGDAGDLDVVRFERGVAEGRRFLRLGQFDRAAFTLAETLSLWRGVPFPDLEHWDVAAIEAVRLHELLLQAEEMQVDASLGAGDHDGALLSARAMTWAEPLRERRWIQLALALVRSGRQGEALASLRRCTATLRNELGLDPSAEVLALEQTILRQDPVLLLPTQAPASQNCPWPGMSAYDADNADSFFGRGAEITSAVTLLRSRGVLVVVGPSGIGKSSFVRAGVVPVLVRDGRTTSIVTPGSRPGLGDGPADVVVVDQCEELFSLCAPEERNAFLNALVETARTRLVVVALRADRMSDVADHPDLARLVERGLFLLGALGEAGLRDAIELPATQAGLYVEPGLVDLLLRDLEDEPGALPLLSHALVETWERREGRTMTVDAYRGSGGVRGAVSQSAESVYRHLTPSEQSSMRALMLRLVSSGPEGEPLRARVPRRLVSADPVQSELVETLVRSRLVTSDDGVVTLAHEALTSAWPRLRSWLDDDVDGRRTLHHLSASADAWESLGRPDSELYRGVRLARAVEWSGHDPVDLAPHERAFLDASTSLSEVEQRLAEDRSRRQARTNRRLRVLLVGLLTVLVAALVAGVLAVRQGQRADDAARASDARRVGAKALLTDDVSRSLLLAVAAARLDPSTDTTANLEATLARYPLLIGSAPVATEGPASRVAATPTGLVVSDRTHHLQAFSGSTLDPVADYRPAGAQPDVWQVPMTFSDRADVLAVAAPAQDAAPVRLLDPATLQPVPQQLSGWPERRSTVASLAVSSDGRFLAATLAFSHVVSDTNGSVVGAQALVWDLTGDGRPVVGRITVPENFYNGVALSPNGGTLFLSNPPAAYDVRSGRALWRHRNGAFDLVISADPSGELLAVTDPEQEDQVGLLDARTGKQVASLRGQRGELLDVHFSHDGRLVAASGSDGLAVVWDAGSGGQTHLIDLGATRLTGVGFALDDQTLYTVTGDARQVQAWDLGGSRRFLRTVPVPEPVEIGMGMVRPGHHGRSVAFMQQGDERPDLRIVDTTRDSTTTLPTLADGWAGAGSWSPDDRFYAVGYDRGRVQLFDAVTGKSLASSRVLTSMVTEVSHSADGRHLVAADDTGAVVRLDAATLEPIGEVVTVPEKIYALTAGPDGHTAFVSAGGTEWRPYWDVPIDHWYLVDLEAGRVLSDGDMAVRNAIYSSFSPDGRHVAVGGRQGEVVLIDLDTGRPVHAPVVGHGGDVYWVDYNDDGSLVTTGSTSHDVALWDGATGDLVGTAALPDGERLAAGGFRDDGTLLVASFSGHLYHWDPGLDHALDFACKAAGRDLTSAEWATEFGDRAPRAVCPD